MAIAKHVSKGTIIVDAMTLVTTRYLKGLVPETSIASICSVTRIDPSSAPIPDPIFPAQISAVITGVISLTNETETMEGSNETAPNSTNVGRD